MITSDCEPMESCEGCGAETFHYGNYGYEPYGGCAGDAVPHSTHCSVTGGDSDWEDFIGGEWLEFTEGPEQDPIDWTCECVTDNVKDWQDAYAEKYGMDPAEVRRQYALSHAYWTHKEQARNNKKELTNA